MEAKRLEELKEKYQGKDWKEADQSDLQELASSLVDREVLQNMSMIVQDNLLKENQEYFEEIENLYPDNTNKIAELEESWLKLDDEKTTLQQEVTKLDTNHESSDGVQLKIADLDDKITEMVDQVNDLKNQQDEMKEVFEWWLVTKWLRDKLYELDEPVFSPNDYNYFWGRCCTGQAICLDHNIQLLAYNTFIK